MAGANPKADPGSEGVETPEPDPPLTTQAAGAGSGKAFPVASTTGVVVPPVAGAGSASLAEEVWTRSLLALLGVTILLALAPRRVAAYGQVGRGVVTARFGFLAVALGVLLILGAQFFGERLS